MENGTADRDGSSGRGPSLVAGLGLAVAVAVLLRLAVVAWVPSVPVSDAWSYYERAANLVDRGRYEAIPGQTDATFPPGYPVLLALLFSIAEPRLLVAKLLNCALGGATVLLTGLLARRVFGDRAALIAAGIAAVHPRAILATTLVFSENLMAPLLLSWLLLLVQAPPRLERWTHPILGGILLGCLSLTRAVGYFLWPIWMAVNLVARRPWRRVVAGTVLIVAVQHAVMAPWAYRNLQAFGAPILLTSSGGIVLFIGNNASATGVWYPWRADIVAIDPEFDRRPLLEQDRVARDAATAWMRAHPADAVELYLRKWWVMFRDDRDVAAFAVLLGNVSPPWPPTAVLPGPHPLKRHASAMLALLDGSYWVILLLGAAGGVVWAATALRSADPRRRAQVVALLGTAAYFPAISAVFVGMSRYRWPTVDLLVPLGAFLVVRALSRGGDASAWHPTA